MVFSSFFCKASLSTLKPNSCDKLGYKHTTSTVTKMAVSGIKSRLLIFARARLNYAPPTTILHQPKYIHHHPPPAKLYPRPPTTSQNISTSIHHHLMTAKIYPPPPIHINLIIKNFIKNLIMNLFMNL